jgi:hypothetical protein
MAKREGPSTWRGHPLFDGKKPIPFHVTQADVKSASLKNHFQCAAAKRLVADGYETACVSLSVAYVVKNGKAYRYSVPPSLRTEIVSFDRGGGFATGTYTINPFPERRKLVGRILAEVITTGDQRIAFPPTPEPKLSSMGR